MIKITMKTVLMACTACTLFAFGLTIKAVAQSPNVALKKPAAQSSTGWEADANRAVDGNTSGDFWKNSVSHTSGGDSEAWWRVDLKGQYTVNRIQIFNRTDCCNLRLTGALVQIEQGTDRAVWSYTITEDQAKEGNFTVDVPNIPGTAVRLIQKNKIDGGTYLALAEVRVYGLERADKSSASVQRPLAESVSDPAATDDKRFKAVAYRINRQAPADAQNRVDSVSGYFADEMSRRRFPEAIRVEWTDRSLEIKWLDWWDYRMGDLSTSDLLSRARTDNSSSPAGR